jgi:hypothetical protein
MCETVLEFIKYYGMFFIASIGLCFTWYQLRISKKNRIADLEPKIGVSLEFDEKDPAGFVYIVIKNYGKTSAYNVTITPKPEPLRMLFDQNLNSERVEKKMDIIHFPKLSVLHPNQRISTLYSNFEFIQTGDIGDLPILTFKVNYNAPESLGKRWKPERNEVIIDTKFLHALKIVKPKEKVYKIQPAKTKCFVVEMYDKEKIRQKIMDKKKEYDKRTRKERLNANNTKN